MKPERLTPARYKARATAAYHRRLDRLWPRIGDDMRSEEAAHYFRVVQGGLSALIPGKQKSTSPGWLAQCLRAHQAAARRVR